MKNFLFLTSLIVLSQSSLALAEYIGHEETRIHISSYGLGLADENSIRWKSDRYKSFNDLSQSWRSHFAGELTFPDPYQNTAGLIRFKNPSCKKQILQLDKLMDSYAVDAEKSHDGSLIETREEISDLLVEGQSNGCFEDLSRLLAARALSLLAQDDRFNTCDGPLSRCKLKDAHFDIDAVHGYLSYNRRGSTTLVSNNWILNLIAISLINHDHVVFMTAEEKARIGLKSNFLGAYDCGSGKIYLDPFMAPYDLAATFAHEIEHVLRDKFLDVSQMSLSAKQFLLLDETLSASFAGFLQRNLNQFYQTTSAKDRALGVISDFVALHFGDMSQDSRNNYDLESDLSFFSPTGPLNSLWTALGFQPLSVDNSSHDGLRLAHSLSTWSDFEDMTFLRADVEKVPAIAIKFDEFGTDKIDENLKEVYGIVKKVYFKESLTEQDRESLNPDHLGLRMDPMSQVLRSTIIPFTQELTERESLDFVSQLSVLQDKKRYSGFMSDTVAQFFGTAIGGFEDEKKTLDIRLKLDGLLDQLDLLEAGFSSPSPACTLVDDAAKRGELDDYAGFRGGAEGVRPGAEGVRPGAEGVRPGAEGVRPGLSIRTCVSLPRKL